MSEQERNTATAKLKTLLDFLDETPTKLAQLTEGLSTAELRLKNSPAEFSALENVCHLRDLELQGYTTRIERMLDETDPVLADFDGARVAAESDYNAEPLGEALQTFTIARGENVKKLRSLTDEQLQREGALAGVGKITLRQLGEMMREHDEGHLYALSMLRQQLRPNLSTSV